jgi:DNA-binding PadR family transcriptional regulator
VEGEMLKGHLDMIVLAALAGGPAHGYAVIAADGALTVFRRAAQTAALEG